MVINNKRKRKTGKGRTEGAGERVVRKMGRGLAPRTIDSMREPRTSCREALEMGGIGDTTPWNQSNPH